MTQEEYAQHLATVSDRVLVDLIDRPEEADPEAVAAAKEELGKRGLPADAIAELRTDRQKKEHSALARKARFDAAVRGAGHAAGELRRSVVEVGDETGSERRPIRWMLAAIGILFLSVCPNFKDLPWLMEGEYDLSTLEHFLPLVLLPLTFYLLWRRKRWGWFLGAGVTMYWLCQSLVSAYWNWNHQPSGFFALDELFPTPSRTEIVLGILFAASVTAIFQLPQSMALFRVSERSRWVMIAAVVALVAWMWWSLL